MAFVSGCTGGALTNARCSGSVRSSGAARTFIDTNAASLGALHRHILATILGDAPALVEGVELPQTNWSAAELLRVAALGLLKEGKTPAAQGLLKEALNISRRQGAFAWELRAATTLAELYLAEG